MKYVILVSHGTFAPGLHSVLEMLAGKDRKDVLSTGLVEGMGTDVFAENFEKLLEGIVEGDEIILLGDIIGGSPLTTSLNILAKKGFIKDTAIFGGVNLPMALNAVLMKDMSDKETLKNYLVNEAKDAIKEFLPEVEDEVEEI